MTLMFNDILEPGTINTKTQFSMVKFKGTWLGNWKMFRLQVIYMDLYQNISRGEGLLKLANSTPPSHYIGENQFEYVIQTDFQ